MQTGLYLTVFKGDNHSECLLISLDCMNLLKGFLFMEKICSLTTKFYL